MARPIPRSACVSASVMAYLACSGVAASQTAASQPAAPVQPATAPQPASDSSAGISDIVVTAQRRTESTQRTSLVIDVVNNATLARANITQVQGLTAVLPSVQIGNVGAATQVYIRGVGDFGSTANSNPSVAFNIDGVYVARSQSISSEFYDVDRIEALKGPQGTLYGRNASGGAINLLTHKPVLGKTEGYVQGEISNYDGYTGEAAINLPLGETVALRASGQIVSKGGYTNEGYGDDKHQSGRLKLLWEPSSDISLLLNGSYGHVGGKGPAFVLKNPLPGRSPWTDQTDPQARAYLSSQLFPALPPFVSNLPLPGDGFNDVNVYNLSAQFDANLGFAKLTVLPAYRHASMRYEAINELRFEVGAGIGPIPPHPETSAMTSIEVRLGNDTPRLKWVVGGYFYNEDQYEQFLLNSGLIQNNGIRYKYDTRSYAAFGQATYSITNAIRLIGGLRYTSDQRKLIDGSTFYVSPVIQNNCLPPLAPPGTLCPAEAFAGDKIFRNVSWKAGLEADLARHSLLYATASAGFKAGGFNAQASPLAGAPSGSAYLFQPEKLTSYEFGIKNRFLDNKLQLNFEAFYWNYQNHQEPRVAIDNLGVVNLSFDNAGKARMYGGSVDIVAKPWTGGTFSLNTEYNNSKYLSYTVTTPVQDFIPGSTGCAVSPPGATGLVTINCAGRQVVRAPTWTGHAGYNHDISLVNGGEVGADVDLQFASSRWLAPDFTAVERAKAYGTLNASLTYFAPDKRFPITGFVRNITQSAAYTGAYAYPFYPGTTVANILPPRTYGANARFNF